MSQIKPEDKLFVDAPFGARIDVLENIQPSSNVDDTEHTALQAEMSRMREELNMTKTEMDPYYKTPKCPDYEIIQLNLDLYQPLKRLLKQTYGAQFVTNAWMKYYELYSHFELLPKQLDRPLTAFCNAELPGASICALNHYVYTQRPYELQWWGSSIVLNEDLLKNISNVQSTARDARDVLGDSYGLWAGNRDRWLMRPENNGDATLEENILDWERRLGPDSPVGGVDLYSHDAGVYVEDDFNSQERANMKVHLGCALAGFVTLKKGGHFIAKQYTFFEPLTYTLIAVYSTMFEQFYIAKPLTSRPFNSEIYLVGKNFIGMTGSTRKLLFDRLREFHSGPLCLLTPPIARQLTKAASRLQEVQVNFIRQNVEYYKRYCKKSILMRGAFDSLKNTLLAEWQRSFPIKRIDSSKLLKSSL